MGEDKSLHRKLHEDEAWELENEISNILFIIQQHENKRNTANSQLPGLYEKLGALRSELRRLE
tara:strand:- start:144 stop:332 length:189 start_codon:yes stop_codon:yes gene_type:complete